MIWRMSESFRLKLRDVMYDAPASGTHRPLVPDAVLVVVNKGRCGMCLMRPWIPVSLVIAVVLISCGGSSSEPDATQSPDASTPPASDATSSPTSVPEADLRYTSESIFNGLASEAVDPPDFVFIELGEQPNNLAARSFEDPDKWLERFEEWGREMGYVGNYESVTNFDTIQYSAEVYGDRAGAEKSFAKQTDDLPKRTSEYYKDIGLNITSSEEVNGESVGDDTFRYRIRFADADTGESGDLVVVMFRDGNLIASVGWVAEFNILIGETVDLAQGLLNAFSLASLAPSEPKVAPTTVPAPTQTPVPTQTSVPVEIGGVPPGFTQYVDNRNGFSIAIPSDWEVDESLIGQFDEQAADDFESLTGLSLQGTRTMFSASEPVDFKAVLTVTATVTNATFVDLDASVEMLRAVNPTIVMLNQYQTLLSGEIAAVFEYSYPGSFITEALANQTLRVTAATVLKDQVEWGFNCTTLDVMDTASVEACQAVLANFEFLD